MCLGMALSRHRHCYFQIDVADMATVGKIFDATSIGPIVRPMDGAYQEEAVWRLLELLTPHTGPQSRRGHL